MPLGGKNIIVKYTLEEEAIAWDTLNAQADDKQEPTKYLKTMIGGSPTWHINSRSPDGPCSPSFLHEYSSPTMVKGVQFICTGVYEWEGGYQVSKQLVVD